VVKIPRFFKQGMIGVFVVGLGTLCAQPRVASTLNAGDYSTDIAPGGYVAIFGSGFGSSNMTASSVPLPATLGGVSVDVSGMPVPLLFVSPGQINGQLPYGISGTVNLTVKVGGASSTAMPVRIVPNAPKFYTSSQGGTGFIVATHADMSLVAKGAQAVKTGESITLFMNSMGEVTPSIAAGAAPGDGSTAKPLNKLVTQPTVMLDTLRASVAYAGLAPGFPGLYQVNFTTPYDDKVGDAAITVTTGAGSAQSGVTLPVLANGFYWVLTGGKFVNNQSMNGLPGNNSALAFRHNNPTAFGPNGNNGWTKTTGLGPSFAATAGVALTLKSGGNTVFDNNGIEAGGASGYYSTAPGNAVLFSMSALTSPTSPSNNVKGIYAGYFRLATATTIDQMIGYFEGPLNVSPSFDPGNIYNTFHMNIFSNVPAGGFTFSSTPRDTGGYVGDVFSSDSTAGTFSFAPTGTERIPSDGSRVPTYRLLYTLKAPLTLPAGEYWFSHDVSTPLSSGDMVTNSRPEHPAAESLKLRTHRPTASVKE
jgi:uncharacterized protein (TIGR03437 family)